MHLFDPQTPSPDDGGGAAATATTTTATQAASTTTTAAEKTVSHDLYRRVVEAKQGLEGQVHELKEQVATLTEKSATVDTLAGQVAEWKGKAEAAEGKFTRWRDIAGGLGTTDTEAIEAAEWAHSRLPEKDRPAIGDWLAAIKAAPDTAPKVLAPWLTASTATTTTAASTTTTTTAATTQRTQTAQPNAVTTGQTQGGTGQPVSAEAFRAAREKGARTGDWSDFRALKKAAGYRVVDKSSAAG